VRSALGERIATAFTILSISRRMNLFRHRALALLAIGAVATSAALAVAVEVASRSVRVELVRTASALVGAADLEVVAAKRGVAEALVDVARAVPGVLEASPVISETVRIATADPAGLPLHILGVDLLAERKSFDFEVERKKAIIRDPLALLAKPDSILITAALAKRLGLEIGAVLRVRAATGARELEIAGLIVDGDLGRAYRGQIAVMDVWALQQLVGAEGFVDRIDLVTDPELRAGLDERVQSAIGTRANVRAATRSEGVVQAILGTLDAMLWGVPVFGIVLAALLSYAALSQLVRARIRRLALMQCVGVTARGIYALVLVDALLLSALGALAGLAAGLLLSPVLVRAFSRLSEHIGQVEIDALSLAPSTLAIVAMLWLGVALTAAILPARSVVNSSPLEVLANGPTPEGVGRVRMGALLHAALTALVVLGLALAPRTVPALPRLAAIAGLGLFALLVSGTDCLRQAVIASRRQLARVPRIGGLIGLSILARPVGSGTSMTAIAAVVALLVALLAVVQSTVASMDEWVATRFDDSAAVFAGAPNSGLGGESIVPAVIELIRQTPGVDDAAILFMATLPFGGLEVPAQAVSADALLRHGAFHPNDTPPPELAAALLRGEVAISYAFARHFGKAIGDSLVLPTRAGERAFRIGGLIRNYAGPTGTLLFDVQTFDAHFARDGATSVRFWSEAPYADVESAIQARVGELQPLFFSHGEEGRGTAARTLARFRALLYVVVGVAALFCGAALLNLLSGSVTSRRRDLAILQVAGARPAEIAAALVVDAGLLALAGIACGTLLGLAAGNVLAQVLFERLGWFIDYRVDAWVLLVPAAVLFASCALIGVAASAKLEREDPIAAMASGG
jgi:putative ABC transport system permease protein